MSSRHLALSAFLLAWSTSALAAEDTTPGPWKLQATIGLNVSQSGYSNNWSSGEKGQFAWVTNADVGAERQVNEKFNWSNLLQLAYGQTSTQEEDPDDPDRNVWSRPDKTTDLILLESVARFTLHRYVDPYASFRLDSVFSDKSNPLGALSFNPVTMTQSVGVARVIEKTDDRELITRVGFGLRENFARTFLDDLGEETDLTHTVDGGLEFQTTASYPLASKKILYKGKLLVFLPLFYDQRDALKEFDTIYRDPASNPNLDPGDPLPEAIADFWKAPDINWQNTFTAQITKVLAVNLYVQFVYDKFDASTNVDTSVEPEKLISDVLGGVRKAGQFKQTLALGITYNLF